MKVTGPQYLDSNPDVKAVGMDALQHVLTHALAQPLSMREARKLDYPDDFDGAAYIAFHKDVAKFYTAETALIHYLEYGWKEEGRWPLPPTPPVPPIPPTPPDHLPTDWNWKWYINAPENADLKMNGISTQEKAEAHYFEYGYNEKRWPIKNIPSLPADWDWQKYVAAYIDLQNAEISTQEEAEKHYIDDGFFEKRWPIGYEVPTTQGLHLILDIPGSQRPLFTGMRFQKGLLLGDYGNHVGGAKIQYWDGRTLTTEKFFDNPKAESVFHLISADDGVPVCSCEFYGRMCRRDTGGTWQTTFESPVFEDLAFGIFKCEGVLYCLICTGGKPDSFMIHSGDQGRTWPRRYNWSGVSPQGCANSDGHRILLTGAQDNVPVVRDTSSNIVARRNDLPGNGYTQICGRDGRWNFAGNAWIDYWENGTPRTVFQSSRRYAMWSECDPHSETRVVLFSAWKEGDPDSQVALSKDGGKTWTSFMVPCSCLFGSHFADGGVYLFGGDWGSGRVYFYKF